MRKQVKMPPFPDTVSEKPAESLVEWYGSLGWDGKENLDPKKVQISKEDWNDICQLYIQNHGAEGGFFFMNYGPSSDDAIPKGHVVLKTDWKGRKVAI
jgi:hypothetical protein